jgi:hypothetical protein
VIEPNRLRGFNPAMASDDAVIVIYENGVGETKRRIALAIWSICFFEWVRGLDARGLSALTA